MNRTGGIVYLDNAATTFPKPQSVTEAVVRCMQSAGGNPGRGSHTMALRAAEVLFDCRREAASLFGAESPAQILFTMNTTYALNTALKSVLRPGDHVLIGDKEHNSVLRPVAQAAARRELTYSIFSTSGTTDDILRDIRIKMRPETRVLVCAHVPNIDNTALPVAEIGILCRARGIVFILDGAQSAGHLPIDVRKMSVDALCVPGHKGLYGPQGCGMIVCGSDHLLSGRTLVEGGSGMHSRSIEMPDVLPERYEAGTMPTPSAAGLAEGIRFVHRVGIGEIHKAEIDLWHAAYDRLKEMPGVHVYGSTPGAVLLFNIDGIPASAVGEELDRRGICVRSGYHCAPLAHKAIGTMDTGAVRASFSVFNTQKDVMRFTEALWQIVLKRNGGVWPHTPPPL